MADLLKKGSAWLEAMRKAHATSAVTYWRGALNVIVQATVGLTTFEVDTGGPALERIESRDYLITAADLVLDGSPVTPEKGDRIKELIGSAVVVYEVLAPGDAPPWRYSDPGHVTFRVHTKFVDTE